MVQKYTYLEPYLPDVSTLVNLNEYEKLFSRPHQTVKRHLTGFLDENILIEEKKGKFIFYKLNLDNPLVSIHLSICEKGRTIRILDNPIFRRLYEVVRDFFLTSSILIFGSAAEFGKYNDIDILIIGKNRKLKQALKEFESTYSKKLHIVMSEEKDLSDRFLEEIRKKHVIFNNHDYFVRLLYGR